MNSLQQRIAIAEACGWTRIHNPMPSIDNPHGIFPQGNKSVYVPIPNYLNDLNAMHEAEKVLEDTQLLIYRIKLSNIVYKYDLFKPYIKARGSGAVIHATAAQRAEAFLRTIGKWIE